MDEDDVIEIIPDEDSPTSTPQGQGNEFKHFWDQEMTFSLIDEYRNNLQDFLYPQGQMIRDIWENISQNMQARGYDVSAAACDQKWRQLKKTFKYNMPNGGRIPKTKWIYYDALEDILGNKQITNRISWKQRSTIKQDPNSPTNDTQDEGLENRFEEETETEPIPVKRVKREEPPKWFENFLTHYQEEEKLKRKMLQKMHTDLVALERQKCILLEDLIKKIPTSGPIPKIVDAITLSQEVFEEEL